MARLLSEGLEDRGRSPATLTRHAKNVFVHFSTSTYTSLVTQFLLKEVAHKVSKIRSVLAG